MHHPPSGDRVGDHEAVLARYCILREEWKESKIFETTQRQIRAEQEVDEYSDTSTSSYLIRGLRSRIVDVQM